MKAAGHGDQVPVYVWDLVVRLTHWTIALSILTLSITGIYIGKPFMTSSTLGTQEFIMGTMRLIHFWTSIAFSVAVLSRIIWMFQGPRYARWNQLVPTTKQRVRDMWGTLRFYIFIDAEPPPAIGHNAMAGFAYIGAFALYIVMILTGFALWGASSHYNSPLRWFTWILPLVGGAQGARWVHHVGMWVLLCFVVQHVYSSTLMARVEKVGVIDSIFGGWKVIPKAYLKKVEEKPRG